MKKVFCKNCEYLGVMGNSSYCYYNKHLGGRGVFMDSTTINIHERNRNNDCSFFSLKDKKINIILKKLKSMKKQVIILSILGVIAFFALGLISSVLSFRTQAVNLEETIKAQYSQNQNNYDNMWKSFKEISQVTDKYATDLKELYDNAMTGRYGENGSQAMFQWLTEQNPNLDPSTYTKLQSTIEAGRNSFQSDQKQLVAKKEQYSKLLRSNKALILNIFLGFPKINMDEYGIVTSEQTDKAFESKKANEVNLFE